MTGQVLVVGGGAAGMMAALTAAKQGKSVTLIEKNEKLGKKLFITGKGRCNVTNASPAEALYANVRSNPRFLYSAFFALDNRRLMALFEDLGVRLKTERGNRVFPESDHSSDIIAALKKGLARQNVRVLLQTEAKGLILEPAALEKNGSDEKETDHLNEQKARSVKKKKERVKDQKVTGVLLKDGKIIGAESVILACGGLSYPSTGSTGDGLEFAKKSGHRIVPCVPALVPLVTLEPEAGFLQGLSLKNVTAEVRLKNKVLFQEFGEMLFTHFGVSGPLMLSASSFISRQLLKQQLELKIDLKPALTQEQLHKRILREFSANANRRIKNVLTSLYPAKLIPVILGRCAIDLDKPAREITKEERNRLVEVTKGLSFTITGTRGFSEAIITQGGISVKDVDPSTMASKLVENLYFAGEMLDVDGLTGGYNLQIAWSTGYLAGISAAG